MSEKKIIACFAVVVLSLCEGGMIAIGNLFHFSCLFTFIY